uniref:uncharacterized protein isoform X2 n=1 Tax=Myxine glutinosa TaxID=7769 RepID=UPI00358E60AD
MKKIPSVPKMAEWTSAEDKPSSGLAPPSFRFDVMDRSGKKRQVTPTNEDSDENAGVQSSQAKHQKSTPSFPPQLQGISRNVFMSPPGNSDSDNDEVKTSAFSLRPSSLHLGKESQQKAILRPATLPPPARSQPPSDMACASTSVSLKTRAQDNVYLIGSTSGDAIKGAKLPTVHQSLVLFFHHLKKENRTARRVQPSPLKRL